MFLARRRRLLGALRATEPAVIIGASTEKMMAHDVPYPHRQAPNFAYLTGFGEPDAVAVIRPNDELFLFVRERNELREMWDGPRHGIEGAVSAFGATEAFNLSELPTKLPELLKDSRCVFGSSLEDHPRVKSIVKDVASGIENASGTIERQRFIKDEAEMDLLRESARIASVAFRAAMASSTPDMYEYEIASTIEHAMKVCGAERLAYPIISAGAERACVLHYNQCRKRLEDGDMVLVDAGCEYQGYASDISRTWPVNGRFTTAQRAVYEAVLDVQKRCLDWCAERSPSNPGSVRDLHAATLEFMEDAQKQLGITPHPRFFPHSIGHWLGMDTHDTPLVSSRTLIEPGVAFTVEPGLYFRHDDMDVPEEYRGIGIRIEDDVLMLPGGGMEVLSSLVPKEVSEIEELIGNPEAALEHVM